MKKNILSILAICAALLGCQKNEISETRPSGVELHATIEDDASTKTVMDENNNIRWSEGDQIIAFMKSSYGHKYKLISSFVGKTYADFEPATSAGGNLSAGTEWNHNVVYYPYSADVEAIKSGDNYTLSVVLPSEQTYAAESFGNGSMAMVAVSEDNDITFRNVLGGMKIQLKGTQKVKSIKLEGKNNEKLSGAATVTAYTDETKPAITMASGASTSVILDCGSGVQLNESTATEFIIALPPVLFSKGFTMTVIDDAGNEQTIQTDKENSVLRSSLLVMPEVTLDKVPQPCDYIDEYGINHGPGVKIGETVWAPVNCGYNATDFKYGKLYQWGRKYGQGYSGELYDIYDNIIGDYSDATVPMIMSGPVSLATGQSNSNEKYYYKTTLTSYPYDWLSPQKDELWNSGDEDNPVKTEYDPCPDGWRVPTYAELNELCQNHSSWTSEEGQPGYWFSGASTYTDKVSQVFFPAAGGYRNYNDNGGYACCRGSNGYYWSSRPNSYYAYCLSFLWDSADLRGNKREYGNSVRCVQE
ncbi:MAG: hypothetical protein J6A22_07320 [Bacteroidales bacterium]|nr:hypothetical protein [Bacteroidales bacterium]